MTNLTKYASLAAALLILLGNAPSAALAQAEHDQHHPQGAPAAGAPMPQVQPQPPAESAAPMKGGGMGGMMGGDQMPMMKMMQEMHGKMMEGGMATQPKGDTGPSSQAFNGITAKMHQDMAITYTGNADVDFVKGMIVHHQGAVDMAKVVLAFGKDPEVKKVAEEVIKAQEAEIAWMKGWIAKQTQ